MKHSAFQSFSESAQETLDFARCQRADGSHYGTSGQCRKGTPTDAKAKDDKGKLYAGLVNDVVAGKHLNSKGEPDTKWTRRFSDFVGKIAKEAGVTDVNDPKLFEIARMVSDGIGDAAVKRQAELKKQIKS